MNLEEHREASIRCGVFLHRIAGILVTLALAGCLATTPIEAEDTGVVQRGVRASFNVNGGNRPASEARSGHAVELGYQDTKVSSNQPLSGTQPPVILNGRTFSGPNQLRNDFDFSLLDLSWRMREFGGGPFGVEIFAGFWQSSLGMTVTSPAQSASRDFNNSGLQLGAGMIWRASASSSIHARGSYYFAPGDAGVKNITKYEFYYANALFRNLSLRAGYSDWKVKGFGDSGMSDFQMHFAGPSLVLDCSFNLGD